MIVSAEVYKYKVLVKLLLVKWCAT